MADALSDARAIQLDAARVGFDWPDIGGAFAKLREEVEELGQSIGAGSATEQRNELGDVLFSAVNVSRFIGVDPADALDAANRKFSARFAQVQREVRDAGKNMEHCSLDELDAFWERSKACTDDTARG